jgi:hypothetical protein
MERQPQHRLEPGDAGFTVDPPALTTYADRARTMAGDLERLAKQRVNSVQRIAEDSFGKIGKESGFAAALNHFAGALEHQVNGVATNVGRFSRAVDRIAGGYQETDRDRADDFRDVDRRRDQRPSGSAVR